MPWSKHWRGVDRGRWNRVRRAAFERDGGRCVRCGSRKRLQADHVKPLSKGGAVYRLTNVQTLCKTCHARKTGREGQAALQAKREREHDKRMVAAMPPERRAFYDLLKRENTV